MNTKVPFLIKSRNIRHYIDSEYSYTVLKLLIQFGVMSRIQHRAKFLFCTCTCRSSRCLARLLKIDDRILGVTFEKKKHTHFFKFIETKLFDASKKGGKNTRTYHPIHKCVLICAVIRPCSICNQLSFAAFSDNKLSQQTKSHYFAYILTYQHFSKIKSRPLLFPVDTVLVL